jgi:methylenetetrahydrofolate dehydrogenase (NADP+)/methenyltetrahydrofolate cyclohydrolase
MQKEKGGAEILESGALVDALRDCQQERVAALPFIPELAIVTTMGDDAAIRTYFRSKNNHANSVGIRFQEFSMRDEDSAMAEINGLNRRSDVSGIVPQLPFRNNDRAQDLCEAITPLKDVDALSDEGREFFDPPTSKAVVELARHHTNNFEGIDPERIAVVGALGRLVGSGAVTLLREEGFDPKRIDVRLNNQDEIRTLGRDVDLIITATGRPGSITPADLKRPGSYDQRLVIIDAGIGTTPENPAVGPLAVAFMFGNVIAAAERQFAMD